MGLGEERACGQGWEGAMKTEPGLGRGRFLARTNMIEDRKAGTGQVQFDFEFEMQDLGYYRWACVKTSLV